MLTGPRQCRMSGPLRRPNTRLELSALRKLKFSPVRSSAAGPLCSNEVNTLTKQCYACKNIATTREHVPPKCLFPDELGEDYRINLITVPSCEKHNNSKCKDDEFLLVNLAGIIGCNKVGLAHKFFKVDRAIHRTGGQLLKKAMEIQSVEKLSSQRGIEFEISWGTPNIDRLQQCFCLIGRGLHYHHYKERFEGRVVSEIVYIPLKDEGRMGYRDFVVDEMEKELSGTKIEGNNPAVFQWVLGPKDATGASCGKMLFYGNLSVFLAFIPEGAPEVTTMYDLAKTATKPVYIKKKGRIYRVN